MMNDERKLNMNLHCRRTERVRDERMMMMQVMSNSGEEILLTVFYVLWEIRMYVKEMREGE